MKTITFFAAAVGLVLLIGVMQPGAMPKNAAPEAKPEVAATPNYGETDIADRLHPECKNTPIGQMTRGQLERCDAIERMLGGISDVVARDKVRRSHIPSSEQECLDAYIPGGPRVPGCVYTMHGNKVSATVVAPR